MRAKITIITFLLLLTFFFSMIVVLPRDEEASVKENRALSEMPTLTRESLFGGKFTADFENYLSDRVAFRSKLTDLTAQYESMKGYNNFGKIVNTTGDLGVGTTTKNQLIVLDDRVMEVYFANEKIRDEYINMINFYAKKLPDNINVYSMIIPTQIDFMEFYNTIGDSEKNSIDYCYSKLDKRITPINIYDTLAQHTDEYIYFRTDHHWTTLGAYYAYNKMAEDLNISKLNIKDFEEKSEAPFLGHLYTQAQTPVLSNHADTVYYYPNSINDIDVNPYDIIDDQLTPYSAKTFNPEIGPNYTLFFAGDHPFIEINTNAESDKTLLLIKDSYSNALLPWLMCGYKQILVIDPRTFKQTVSEIIEKYHVDDFLFANYIMSTNFEDYIEVCRDIYD